MIFTFINYFAAIDNKPCSGGGSFLGFPTWYEYLPSTTVNGVCSPAVNSLSDVWLIVLAVIAILLRIAALAAVGFIIYAGFSFIVADGDPAKAAKARLTIISALVGLAIAIFSATIIGFLAGSIK